MNKIFLTCVKFITIVLLFSSTGCNKGDQKDDHEEDDADFCSCVEAEDINKTIFLMNEFLAGLPDDDCNNCGYHVDPRHYPDIYGVSKLLRLETWLQSHACVSYVRVGCHACMDSEPRKSRIAVSFDENRTAKDYISGLSLSFIYRP